MTHVSSEYRELIDLIKSVLHGVADPLPSTPDIDFEELFIIARRNGVANTVTNAVCSWDGVPTELKEKFQKQYLTTLAQQVSREHALRAIYYELDKNRIHCIFLKGTLLSGLYPFPYVRSMSDVDAYVEVDDVAAINVVMFGLGYHPGVAGSGNHYEYMLGDMVKVEYHPELVALESEYGRFVFRKIYPDAPLIAAQMDVWGHSISLDGYEYAMQLQPEYHYVYVIMRMMNHFLTAGTGIRSIMVVWVMNSHYGSSWDREKVEELLDEFGLTSFERHVLALADRWFDLGDLPYLPVDVEEKTLGLRESYILDSGTYGSTVHYIAREVGERRALRTRCAICLADYSCRTDRCVTCTTCSKECLCCFLSHGRIE